MNPAGLRARAGVLSALRAWLDAHGYLEVPTPALVQSPAMEEHLHAVAVGQRCLRTSPEFALKRVVASGLPRVYEIGPCWRERESGPWHGREFTMLEWYRVGAQLSDLMDEVEALVGVACSAVGVRPPSAWRRVSVRGLFTEVCGLDLTSVDARALSGLDEPWDDAFFRRWVTQIEPALAAQPAVFVYDWPASQCALARVRTEGEWPVALRFEAYLNGVELANAFDELIDSAEQRRRFDASNRARVAAGESAHALDAAFIEAVGRLPRTCGIALGVDRLVAAVSAWSGIAPGRVDG